MSKKKTEGITNVQHIKSVEIPVNPKKKKYKFIYVVASCHDKSSNFRVWAFYDSKEKAIEEGIFGWSDAETFYESGYYTHIVVEKIPLNHPMPSMEQLGDDDRTWFKFVPKEANKKSHDIRKAIVPCKCPKEFKHTIGFF